MEYEWKKTEQLGLIHEGQFDSFWITGWPQSVEGDGHGWYIQSKPAEDDDPLHCFWVANGEFKSVRQADNKLLIGERVVTISIDEENAIRKAVQKWDTQVG